VPLFRHLPPTFLGVKLRYRVNDGTLRLSYLLQDLEHVFDDEIGHAIERVKQTTKLPVYLGDLADMPKIFTPA
jgi:hypothetical protein